MAMAPNDQGGLLQGVPLSTHPRCVLAPQVHECDISRGTHFGVNYQMLPPDASLQRTSAPLPVVLQEGCMGHMHGGEEVEVVSSASS